MTLLVALIIGIVFGGIVGALFHRGADYFAIDILIGVCGAILMTAIYFFAHISSASFGVISFGGAVASALGAGFALLIYQLILLAPKRKHKSLMKPDDSEE
ncbi:MAG TPA: hypothetical protein VFN56_03050 [Candidatus Saccharimonadales bacterium]|nr:hypothetical protein [Candidatus Saccharimonadales bacterium]